MKTEDIQRTRKGRDPNEVSRALQELTPLSCVVVDRRGRPVPLSGAGFVLRLGKSYRLQIRTPFPDEDIASVRIICPPSFLTLEPELLELDAQGRWVRTIPFTVTVGWLAQMARLNLGVFSDELEITYEFKRDVSHQPPPYFCPIVAQPSWTLVFMAVVIGLVWALGQKVVADFSFAERRVEAARHFAESLLDADFWLWLAAVTAAVWLLVTLVNSVAIYLRARELELAFREHFPCA